MSKSTSTMCIMTAALKVGSGSSYEFYVCSEEL